MPDTSLLHPVMARCCHAQCIMTLCMSYSIRAMDLTGWPAALTVSLWPNSFPCMTVQEPSLELSSSELTRTSTMQNDPGVAETPHLADAPAGPFQDERPGGDPGPISAAAAAAAGISRRPVPAPARCPGPLRELPWPSTVDGCALHWRMAMSCVSYLLSLSVANSPSPSLVVANAGVLSRQIEQLRLCCLGVTHVLTVRIRGSF